MPSSAPCSSPGQKVHVYTSPHLVKFHERIRDWPFRPARTGRRCTALEESAHTWRTKANGGEPITFFEITTAAAFLLFAEHPADVLLLEVGLGGRVDATNVVQTSGADDRHACFDRPSRILGRHASRKSPRKAVFQVRGVTGILAEQNDNALAVLEAQANRLNAPVFVGGQDFAAREENGRFVYEDERGLLDLPLPKLVGRHQQFNAGTPMAAVRRFDASIPATAIEAGLTQADWPARLQRLKRGRVAALAPREAEVWLDGGHNADGGRALAQVMADFEEKSPRPLILICGTLVTKATRAFLRPFKGLAQEVIAVPIGGDHYGRLPADVALAAQQEGIPAAASESVGSALEYLSARDWSAPPRILITGSLYLAGEVLRLDRSEVS